MTGPGPGGRQARPAVPVSYAAFVLLGIGVGASGVLLPSQMAGYGVDRATIGISFFTISAGWVLAGMSSGALIHRSGVRFVLVTGGGAFMLSGLCLATRPPFAAFVLVQVLTGYGGGVLESALNAYLTSLPGATTLLNRLHAFWGAGALLGPPLATWILGFASWTVVWLVLAAACVPLLAGFLVTYPGQAAPPAPAEDDRSGPASMLGAALRDRGVQLGAAMLAVYVGLEASIGSWGFSYLVQARGLSESLAGYAVSGYWLGLTLGRFLISAIAARAGVTTAAMMYACMAGVTAAAALAWLSPIALTCVALGLLGFFLGPVFPTTMAMTPRLTDASLVPTAIGVMNAAAVAGGSAMPWLAGTIAQSAGMRVILPFTIALALAQVALWRPIASRLDPSPRR
ncbi:MAG TPA: MFS transporter [Streptosporangiaceae bacterium]|nr:MFS transporter [Streptosporangiaceae bacterium]